MQNSHLTLRTHVNPGNLIGEALKRDYIVTHRPVPIYFNSSFTTPIEIGLANILFYQQFIIEYGSNKMNKHLWPGETLHSLIERMIQENDETNNPIRKAKGEKLIQEYEGYYKTLVDE